MSNRIGAIEQIRAYPKIGMGSLLHRVAGQGFQIRELRGSQDYEECPTLY